MRIPENSTPAARAARRWLPAPGLCRAGTALFAALWLGTPGRAVAQAADTSAAALADRLARAEEAIALLRQQLAAAAESEVRAESRAPLVFFGRVMSNAFLTDGRTSLNDVPTLALLAAPAGGAAASDATQGSFGATVRQSTFGIGMSGRPVWGAALDASLELDFFGGVQDGPGGRRLFPEPRIRTAHATLRWTRAAVSLRQDVPLIADIKPASLASVGVPLFATAGNLWYWLPQVRGTWESTGPVRFAIHGAVIGPWAGGETISGDPDNIDIAERARRPFLQGRVGFAWGEDERRGEVSLGGHVGWLMRDDGTRARSPAVALLANVPLAGWLSLRGTAYTGAGLRGLGGGGIGQNFGADGTVLRDRAGWAQLVARPDEMWQFAAGCGVSDPDDSQGPDRLRNRSCEGSIEWRPGGLAVFGAAWREVTTTYPTGIARARHLNLVTGVEF